MINYKIIEKEKAGDYRNYNVYYIYRNVAGLKLWVKSFDQYIGFGFILALLLLPSALLSCGCSDIQSFTFIKVYAVLASIAITIFLCFIKEKFDSYSDAEDHIKSIIRKKAKKNKMEVADFTFDSKGSNISKTINKNYNG